MALIRDNTMPLQSSREVPMLRLSLQCFTFTDKTSQSAFRKLCKRMAWIFIETYLVIFLNV